MFVYSPSLSGDRILVTPAGRHYIHARLFCEDLLDLTKRASHDTMRCVIRKKKVFMCPPGFL